MTQLRSHSKPARAPLRILIVGAGVSGLCLAIKLKKAGFESIQILEKSQDIGGTWLDNTYPGCACDIPAALYSFSFALKHDWSRKYPPQQEILRYFRQCAERFEVRSHVRFGTAVKQAHFDESESVWRIQTDQGEEFVADIFVSAVGQLNRPKIPDIAGLDSFPGPVFHTARWNHDCRLEGRKIAVIGNGASAIQVVPQVARDAEKVFIFQRTPNWIAPRDDYRYPLLMQQMLRWLPGAARVHRQLTFWRHEWRICLYNRRGLFNRGFTTWLRSRMRKKVPPHLAARAIPTYPAGCKRVLLSNDYLESLQRDNVELVTSKILGVSSEGIITGKGTTAVDAIALATGFESNPFLHPMEIQGRDGTKLSEVWSVRPRTYLGIMSAGFPNFFMLYGPNTNLGHNSIIFMVECQVRFILQRLRSLVSHESRTVEVRASAAQEFDRDLQAKLKHRIWNGYVNSWYKNSAGHIVNNWYGSTVAYWWRTRFPDEKAFELRGGDAPRANRSEAEPDMIHSDGAAGTF